MDDKFIGIHFSFYDIFPQPPGSVDDYHIRKTGFGIDGEHYAARGFIRAHHFLDSDGKSDFEMVESLVFAVGNCPVSEKGRKTFFDGLQKLVFSADIKI